MNSCVLGFNGGRLDPVSGTTHLGNGYRAYSPALMRFNCPDTMSPFGMGGINPYAYCTGDPINRADPSGHMSWQAGLGMGLGVLGIIGAAFTGGISIAAAESISAALAEASTVSLFVGTSALVGDATGVASAATEQSNPKASAVLGWVSLAAGILSLGAGAMSGNYRLAGKTISKTSLTEATLRGRGPMLATEAAGHLRPLDGINPHNFRYLGQSPGYAWGGFHNWLDYSFYDYINGELRLNVATHGSSGRVSRLMLADAGDNGFTVRQAMTWFRNNGYPLESGMIKRVRFLMCEGAKNGYGSFVAKFAEASGITTTGWPEFLGIDGPLDGLLRNVDMEFPGNREFLAGIGEYFVESSSQTSDLLYLSEGTPVTYRTPHPGLIEQDPGAYF
jgi:RHS repeat-associated protein